MMVAVPRQRDPRMLPGSLIILRRKCGKPSCHCASGAAHETPALSYSVGGKTKMLTLSAEEVPAVAKAVKRYREAVSELETEARAELESLVARVQARRSGGR